jgi:hypothetical protein
LLLKKARVNWTDQDPGNTLKLPINFFSNPSHPCYPTAINSTPVPLKINNKILFIFLKENIKILKNKTLGWLTITMGLPAIPTEH